MGVTKNIDMSLIIKFSRKDRACFSHLQIKDLYFNQNVIQKIRDAIINNTAQGNPPRVAINTNTFVNISEEIGTI